VTNIIHPEDPLMTTVEAARYLRIGKSTLDNKRYLGGGPSFLKFGKIVRYRKSELDRWADSLAQRSTSDQTAA